MNIYLRELKANRKSLIFWCLGILFMVMVGMSKYAATSTTDASLNEIIMQFPKGVQTIFGTGTFDLSKASGFYGVLFLYLVFMAATHAGLLGAGILSKEERDKTVEFLCVKPVSRIQILKSKLFAVLTHLVIFNVITLIASVISISLFGKGENITTDILLLMVGMFFIQLIFALLGLSLACATSKPQKAASVTTAIILATFMLSLAIDIVENINVMSYLTPFKYFDAKNVMFGGGLNPVFVSLSIIWIAILLRISIRSYPKRDLKI